VNCFVNNYDNLIEYIYRYIYTPEKIENENILVRVSIVHAKGIVQIF